MTEKLLVPDIGDFENVEVIELLVKEGQEIQKNDPIITIESDKSSVEIPSTISGKIESIIVKVGDKVSKGDLILTLSNSNQSSSTSRIIPKDTENLIQEAEKALKKNQEQKPQIEKEKHTIQVVKEGDLDPLETEEGWLELDILSIKYPFETLSTNLTFIDSILPEKVDGISTLDLSLSIVTTGSFFLICCPSLTKSSITSTFSKSPMSGTNNFSVIYF